jgi:hypothetical protein
MRSHASGRTTNSRTGLMRQGLQSKSRYYAMGKEIPQVVAWSLLSTHAGRDTFFFPSTILTAAEEGRRTKLVKNKQRAYVGADRIPAIPLSPVRSSSNLPQNNRRGPNFIGGKSKQIPSLGRRLIH